jgi:TfoX/Sxy family transcriptional regulator of competence genes
MTRTPAGRQDGRNRTRSSTSGLDRRPHLSADDRTSRRRSTSGFPTQRFYAYAQAVAYDEDLAHRIRDLLSDQRGLSEKKMFGGLAFLVDGNMAIAASGQGGLLVRADPAESDQLVATGSASVAVMRGRPMAGWLRVPAERVKTKRQLQKWVTIGSSFARSLPKKSSTVAKGSTRSRASVKTTR